MRWIGVASVLVIAACQGGGVEIIVYPPADPGAPVPDDIRLYVGLGAGEALHLATASFTGDRTRRGELWTRDTDEPAFDHGRPASPTSPVRFTYAARGNGDTISVIAVGMTGGVPTSAVARYDLVVPTAHVAVYTVGLNPASQARPGSADNNQLELWGPHPGDETCAQLVDTRADHDDPRYPISFITSPGDDDCDGFTAGSANECDDHVYRATVMPGIANLSCLVGDPIVTSNGSSPACRLGGPQCTDGDAAGRRSCVFDTKAYCAPQSLCGRCLGAGSDKAFGECAIDPVGNAAAASEYHIECLVPTSKSVSGAGVVCPATYTFALPFITPGGASCANPMFHGPMTDDVWSAKIAFASGTLVPAATAGCGVSLTTTKVPDFSGLPYGGLLAVDVAPTRGEVLPIVFVVDPVTRTMCDAQSLTVQCHPAGPTSLETLSECLANAPPSS